MTTTAATVRRLFVSGDLDLDQPGSGNTPLRLHRLAEIARGYSVGVARLAEAHTDAVAILVEAGRCAEPGALYGVWASQGGGRGVEFDEQEGCLNGTMGFASGLGIVDRALITAFSSHGTLLLDVDVRADGRTSLAYDDGGWATAALADTATGPIEFFDHLTKPDAVVAAPGWYLERIGFWHGACGPAACWAGGAIGLIDAALDYVDDNEHRRAHHGALLAHRWMLGALLDAAGCDIDHDPFDGRVAERTARSLRFGVAASCREVLDRFGRAFGPRPYVQSEAIARRAADLDLYIKQHHAERELPAISLLLVDE